MPGAETFRASADAYERHVGRYGSQLASALIDFAGIEPGMRALDVGCGPGALTAALVERLGTANVSGVDPSEPFAEACGARLPGVEVAVAAAESLPFGDGAFDASLSQLVVNFMGDAEAGVREMARVTRPGGVVASCVWDYAGEMTLLRAFWDAAREVDPDRGAAADEGIVMRWCGEGELAELWSTAGLRDVRFGPLVVHASYADFEDLWSPLPSGVAPSGAFCKSLDSDGQAALHDAYRRRLAVGDGAFELSARAWAVAGTVPSGMASGNADLVRPIYEQWGRGNWVPRFEVYHPRMQWGWSDEFPGLDGVYEDHADPNPQTARLAQRVGALARRGRGLSGDRRSRCGARDLPRPRQGQRRGDPAARGARLRAARRQGGAAGDLREPGEGHGVGALGLRNAS